MVNKLIAIVVAASALVPVHAVAQNRAEEPIEIKVSYADLNLSDPAGRATLDSRIKGAARFVCGTAAGRSLAEHSSNRTCRSGAMEGANAQLEKVLAGRSSGSVLAVRR